MKININFTIDAPAYNTEGGEKIAQLLRQRLVDYLVGSILDAPIGIGPGEINLDNFHLGGEITVDP